MKFRGFWVVALCSHVEVSSFQRDYTTLHPRRLEPYYKDDEFSDQLDDSKLIKKDYVHGIGWAQTLAGACTLCVLYKSRQCRLPVLRAKFWRWDPPLAPRALCANRRNRFWRPSPSSCRPTPSTALRNNTMNVRTFTRRRAYVHLRHVWLLKTNFGKEVPEFKMRTCPWTVRFQVLTAASMKITVFWDAAPCNAELNDVVGRSLVQI
jgi:hypothetical protein